MECARRGGGGFSKVEESVSLTAPVIDLTFTIASMLRLRNRNAFYRSAFMDILKYEEIVLNLHFNFFSI